MVHEHPAVTRRVLVRSRPLSAGVLAAVGALAVAAALTVLVARETAGLLSFDTALVAGAERAVAGSAVLLAGARAVTLLGDPLLVTVLAALLAAWLLARGRHAAAAYVVVVRVGAAVLSPALKALVDRARPVWDEPVATALGASFPSGHALGSAVFWTTCAVLAVPRVRRPRLLLAGAVLVAVLVSASRVLLGVHYLSDVTGGLLLGLGWAALCTAVFVLERAERGAPVDPEREGIGT